ncbi:MAG: single-stranded-DNA-specific exonuclease RecJ [Phycisphaeraceae bacterium]|nr:single-stranded-DNA-specific exonuclease RecJ [Phycisphaeraceae bacterium]MCW5763447.1 single-stranded-DNA-specific exonuclease RecJ [Phycisphaeraceae bacterium]
MSERVPEAIERGLKFRWKTAPCAAGGPLVERVLARRAIAQPEAFLNPSLSQLSDPSVIPGVDRAAERLLSAARAREPIVIYGDYDVDGITATAIVYRMLRAIEPEARITTYVPHRIDEGYGLSAEAIAALAAEGARVIVSVDCGITAVEPARIAREAGVDLIITDHHNPPADGAPLPGAFAIVHPALAGEASTLRDLCGAGVAYKLAWRLATMASGAARVHDDLRTLLIDLLGLVALGTIADVVPLVGENRVLTHFGLGRIRSTPFIGLRALVAASGLAKESIDTERVGFSLAPRINACGRMGHAREAIELLLTDDLSRAEAIACELASLNDQRRATERAIVDEASQLAEAAGMTGADRRAIVLAHEAWHPGVVGIVCSRLVERFSRPVLLMQRQAERSTGSGRSIDGFNLHAALAACAGHLESFGGHDMAAGLRVRHECYDAFVEAFLDHAGEQLAPSDLVRTLEYDVDATLGEFSLRAVEDLSRLAPFGRGNPPVRLRVRGGRLNAAPRTMGARGAHLTFDLAGGEERGGSEGPGGSGGRVGGVRVVGWNWGDVASQLGPGATIDAILTPKLSTWGGRTKVEAELADLRVI